jgi:GPH family glycoside/pentoside/hexuronide:cation symporter
VTESQEQLPRGVIWAYCLPNLGVGFMGMLFGVYLMKYSTDVLLIAPAAMGLLFMIGRFWDAVSDPLAGYLSDRSSARRGRRRAWMYASAVPLALTTVMLWSPPGALQGWTLVLWMGVALLVYETASTVFFVPYGALGMELTSQYHERTRLFGYRHVIAAAGSGLGLLGVYLLRTSEHPRTTAFAVAALGGAVTAAMILYAAVRLPERSEYQGRGAASLSKAFTDVFRNPHARLLLAVYAIETFGAAAIGMLAPYVMQYVVEMPDMTEAFIAIYFVPQFAFTPLWIRLSRRFGKKRLWIFSMSALAIGYLGLFFVREGGVPALFILPFLLGLGGGCGAVVAPAIQADVIDYDELQTGERKEGAYLAVWNLIRKGAGAITPMIAGFVLELQDYQPNVEQSEATKTAILALLGLLPAVFYAIGTVIFLRFSLNEKEHAAVREALQARAEAATGSEPGGRE